MIENIKKVVGAAFIEDGKLLIVQSKRSSRTNSWTFVGGGIEKGETEIEACIREVGEEIHNNFTINESNLTPVMCFKESAASDPTLTIEMNVFICNKKINVDLIPNEEILHYHWFKIGETEYNLSSSIRDHFLPFAIEKGLIF
ncbi:MAG: NUDIX domain-containing protein [Bacilli bacterium]